MEKKYRRVGVDRRDEVRHGVRRERFRTHRNCRSLKITPTGKPQADLCLLSEMTLEHGVGSKGGSRGRGGLRLEAGSRKQAQEGAQGRPHAPGTAMQVPGGLRPVAGGAHRTSTAPALAAALLGCAAGQPHFVAITRDWPHISCLSRRLNTPVEVRGPSSQRNGHRQGHVYVGHCPWGRGIPAQLGASVVCIGSVGSRPGRAGRKRSFAWAEEDVDSNRDPGLAVQRGWRVPTHAPVPVGPAPVPSWCLAAKWSRSHSAQPPWAPSRPSALELPHTLGLSDRTSCSGQPASLPSDLWCPLSRGAAMPHLPAASGHQHLSQALAGRARNVSRSD